MFLCVRTPDPLVVAAWQEHPERKGRPLVIGGQPSERLPVLALSEEARRAGVVEGMPLRQAQQRCPEAIFLSVPAGGADRVRRALCSALYAFTPAMGEQDGAFFLELDGLLLQWPDRRRLLQAIAVEVETTLRAGAALGLGENLFVSRLVAAHTSWSSTRIVEPQDTAVFLAPLPIRWLPLDEDMHEYLDLLGLKTLGAVRTISRAAWQRQFGAKAMAVYDLAGGIDRRPLQPWRPPVRIQEAMPLDPPVDNLEALQFIVRGLCDRVGEALRDHALGTRWLEIGLGQDGERPLGLGVRFAYPMTAPPDLFVRVRARLLRARLVAPVDRVTLTARSLEPIYVRQPGLLIRRDGFQESLADAVLRLKEEYRPELVQRAARVETAPPLADRRFRWTSA
jgi:DNA polymerase-4